MGGPPIFQEIVRCRFVGAVGISFAVVGYSHDDAGLGAIGIGA